MNQYNDGALSEEQKIINSIITDAKGRTFAIRFDTMEITDLGNGKYRIKYMVAGDEDGAKEYLEQLTNATKIYFEKKVRV